MLVKLSRVQLFVAFLRFPHLIEPIERVNARDALQSSLQRSTLRRRIFNCSRIECTKNCDVPASGLPVFSAELNASFGISLRLQLSTAPGRSKNVIDAYEAEIGELKALENNPVHCSVNYKAQCKLILSTILIARKRMGCPSKDQILVSKRTRVYCSIMSLGSLLSFPVAKDDYVHTGIVLDAAEDPTAVTVIQLLEVAWQKYCRIFQYLLNE